MPVTNRVHWTSYRSVPRLLLYPKWVILASTAQATVGSVSSSEAPSVALGPRLHPVNGNLLLTVSAASFAEMFCYWSLLS